MAESSARVFEPVHTITSSSIPSSTNTRVEAIETEEEEADTDTDDKEYAPISIIDRAQLTRLATQQSRRASVHSESGNGLMNIPTLQLPLDDPSLNPQHKDFNLYKWLRLFINDLDQEGITPKRAGIVFKNLNVSGTGAAIQLQNTISSMLMAPLRLGEMFGSGKKQHKPILCDFNGVIKSGELLIVLGRPGSGCSTFLKSLCGEMHGLDVHSSTVVHYNGIPQKQMLKEFKGEVVYNQEVSLFA
jgi:ATP-binding cassette subfamily G (WHITE) protein 2 (PDR)